MCDLGGREHRGADDRTDRGVWAAHPAATQALRHGTLAEHEASQPRAEAADNRPGHERGAGILAQREILGLIVHVLFGGVGRGDRTRPGAEQNGASREAASARGHVIRDGDEHARKSGLHEAAGQRVVEAVIILFGGVHDDNPNQLTWEGMIPQKNVDPEDVLHGKHWAAQRTDAPLDDFMVRLMAEELPFLDSKDRVRVYEILREHTAAGGDIITSQDELPAEIRQLMDL